MITRTAAEFWKGLGMAEVRARIKVEVDTFLDQRENVQLVDVFELLQGYDAVLGNMGEQREGQELLPDDSGKPDADESGSDDDDCHDDDEDGDGEEPGVGDVVPAIQKTTSLFQRSGRKLTKPSQRSRLILW